MRTPTQLFLPSADIVYMSIIPKTALPVRLPQLPLSRWPLPANSDTVRTALETARRMGWQGVVTGGEEVAVAKTATLASEGLGASLWGALRIGLPILTLGLMMEGDESRKPLPSTDFIRPHPDKKINHELDLDFLKQQKTLAELTGNETLATILDIHIRALEFRLAMEQAPQKTTSLQGRPIQILNSVGGNSMPVRKTPTINPNELSEEDRDLWLYLDARFKASARAVFRFLVEKKVPPNHLLLDTFVSHHSYEPSAAYAIAWYRMWCIMDNAPQYGSLFNGISNLTPHSIVKDVPINHMPRFWDTLLAAVSRGHDAVTRRYALQVTQQAMRLAGHQVSTFRSIMEAGLQDPDPLNVWLTWKIFRQYLPEEAHAVTEHDLDSPAQLAVSSSPQFGLAKYLHGTEAQILMRHEIFMTIWGGCDIAIGLVSWKQFQPIHSLADFNPDASERLPKTHDKQVLFFKLADQLHLDPEMILHEFLIGDPLSNNDAAKVIILPSGKTYLVQGHHRIAALIDLAQRGEIPTEWLNRLPVYVMRYDGEVPEVIVQRVLTLGIDMNWPDLFPPSTF